MNLFFSYIFFSWIALEYALCNAYENNSCYLHNTSIIGKECLLTNESVYYRYCSYITLCIQENIQCNPDLFIEKCIIMLYHIRIFMGIFYFILFGLSIHYFGKCLKGYFIHQLLHSIFIFMYIFVLFVIPLISIIVRIPYFLEIYGSCVAILLLNFLIFHKCTNRTKIFINPYYANSVPVNIVSLEDESSSEI